MQVAQCLLDIDSEKATCRREDMEKIDTKIKKEVGFDEVTRMLLSRCRLRLEL